MAVRADGRPSVTKLKVVERFGNEATYVELTLVTGRTHQIRVHTSNKKDIPFTMTHYTVRGREKLKHRNKFYNPTICDLQNHFHQR